jgi:hypothetical protein
MGERNDRLREKPPQRPPIRLDARLKAEHIRRLVAELENKTKGRK